MREAQSSERHKRRWDRNHVVQHRAQTTSALQGEEPRHHTPGSCRHQHGCSAEQHSQSCRTTHRAEVLTQTLWCHPRWSGRAGYLHKSHPATAGHWQLAGQTLPRPTAAEGHGRHQGLPQYRPASPCAGSPP